MEKSIQNWQKKSKQPSRREGCKTHRFVYPRAKDFMDKYTSAVHDKYGDDANVNEITDMELWEKCGENSKGMLLGSGRRQDPYLLLTGTPRSHASASSSCSSANVEEIQRLKETLVTLQENETSLRAQLQENESTLRKEIEDQRLASQQQTEDLKEQVATLNKMMLQRFQSRDLLHLPNRHCVLIKKTNVGTFL